MQRARVIGRTTSTTKHKSFAGFRLLIAQAITGDNKPDGDPLVVIDALGAGIGATVLISSDGKGARALVGDKKSPIRYFTIGLED